MSHGRRFSKWSIKSKTQTFVPVSDGCHYVSKKQIVKSIISSFYFYLPLNCISFCHVSYFLIFFLFLLCCINLGCVLFLDRERLISPILCFTCWIPIMALAGPVKAKSQELHLGHLEPLNCISASALARTCNGEPEVGLEPKDGINVCARHQLPTWCFYIHIDYSIVYHVFSFLFVSFFFSAFFFCSKKKYLQCTLIKFLVYYMILLAMVTLLGIRSLHLFILCNCDFVPLLLYLLIPPAIVTVILLAVSMYLNF